MRGEQQVKRFTIASGGSTFGVVRGKIEEGISGSKSSEDAGVVSLRVR